MYKDVSRDSNETDKRDGWEKTKELFWVPDNKGNYPLMAIFESPSNK